MQYAAIQSWSATLQAAFCSGPAPSVMNKIISRADAGITDWYAEWATHFALLSDAYINANYDRVGGFPEMFQRGWKPVSDHRDAYYRRVGDACIAVEKHPCGWVVELFHEACRDPDCRILTLVRGDMPVLCSSLPRAVQLAEGCFPNAHYLLYWHPYW